MLAEGLTRPATLEEAFAYCRRVALGHYENFTVASWLLPRTLRPHMYAIYAYCRGVDDLGDEAEGDRLALLDGWETELRACYKGTPSDPRFVALAETVRAFDIPAEPFLRLVEANRRDQRVSRYSTFDELLEYCSHSANPVGHLVLYLFGYRDPQRQRLADATCTALQLTNFWQHVSVDLDKGRLYMPLEDVARFGCREEEILARRDSEAFRRLMAFQVRRTRQLFERGLDLIPLVRGRLRLDLRLFSLGGLAVLEAIERLDYDVLSQRPQLSKVSQGVAGGPGTAAAAGAGGRCHIDDLSAAYDYCQALTRREAKNFYYGFLLLPWRQRRAIYAAYAFARRCDDIADEGLPTAEAAQRLAAYRESLDGCLAGCPEGPVFTALNDAFDTCGIRPEHLYGLIEGVERDLTVRRYATFEELREYCYLVASTVGLISIEVFGYRGGETARGHASDLGIALQLTNILRDIQEDAARGRIYLPQDELARFDYSEEELLSGRVTPAFGRLLAYQAGRTRQYYAQGRGLLPYLPRRARACVGVMAGIYSRILDDIEREPEAVFRRRVGLSTGQKLALAGRELVRSLAL